MESSPSNNLLDESLVGGGGGGLGGRVVLVEDRVETSGAFVLHHLVKRALASSQPTGALVFVALSHPFSHYDRILRKMGCNLSLHRGNGRLHFLELLNSDDFHGETGKNTNEDGFVQLYAMIHRAVEAALCSRGNGKTSVTIMIDDLSLLEIPVRGYGDRVLDFMHYCVTLTSEMACSLVLLIHEDIYSTTEATTLLTHLEYLADILIKTEPLSTGLATDVHGQLTVTRKRIINEHGNSTSKISNFHFKVRENGVECFFPGSRH